MKKVLLQAFDEDTLPTFLGGTVDFDAVRESFTAKVDRTLADLCQQESSRQMAKEQPRALAMAASQQGGVSADLISS